MIFIIDICLQFRIAFPSTAEDDDRRWILDGAKIFRHYGCSYWFALDLFSVLVSLFDVVGDESTDDLKALRAVRTIRLIKLLKLARGSRIFKRWEMRMSINYSYLTLSSIVGGILIACHWFACIFGLSATFNPLNSWPYGVGYCVEWGDANETLVDTMLLDRNGECSSAAAAAELALTAHAEDLGAGWICNKGECNGGVCERGHACAPPLDMYSYSLYFVVMTITSVGYGDITATPFNPTEQFVMVGIMLCTGMLWGYLIGIFCTMASPSPLVQEFRHDLSSLNEFMSSHNVALATRYRLREFMHQTAHLKTMEGRQKLLGKLSPAMQGEMSLLINERTVHRVWYLASAETGLLIDLAAKLKPLVFPPSELCPAGFLYIIERGTALYAGRTRHQGSTWGDDVLLNRPDLQLDFPAVPISYVWVYILSSEDINSAVHKFPAFRVWIETVKRRWIIRRAIVRYAEQMCHASGGTFRGHSYPIYAKVIALALTERARLKEAGADQFVGSSLTSKPGILRREVTRATPARKKKATAKSPTRMILRSGGDAEQQDVKHRKEEGKREMARAAAADYGMQLRQIMMGSTMKKDTTASISRLESEVASLRSTSTGLQSDVSQMRDDIRTMLAMMQSSAASAEPQRPPTPALRPSSRPQSPLTKLEA